MNLKGAVIQRRDTLALHGDVIPLQQQVTYTPGDEAETYFAHKVSSSEHTTKC